MSVSALTLSQSRSCLGLVDFLLRLWSLFLVVSVNSHNSFATAEVFPREDRVHRNAVRAVAIPTDLFEKAIHEACLEFSNKY